jgi:diguanylate cyclase (GGDEF)-like protein
MHSLYQALLLQHGRQLTPVRCAEQTIAQLHRYFEDVVLENNLSALVIESLPSVEERSLRDVMRVREIGRTAHKAFFFVAADDGLNTLQVHGTEQDREPIFLKRSINEKTIERFVVIADARFSALLASVKESDDTESLGDEVIWTFEPDIVYSALEYLMARVTAEKPVQATTFASAVRTSMPKATSLQLTVSVTTKLARLLQEQTGREIAVNRIASAIRNTLDVDEILQTTVNEVGRALDVQHCALRIEGENGDPPSTKIYFRNQEEDIDAIETEIHADVEAYFNKFSNHIQPHVLDGRSNPDSPSSQILPLAVVPLLYQQKLIGALLVRSNDASRVWQENEVLLLQTVADQVAVAVRLACLFDHTQKQALTDALTGCYNRRSFEIQLERELRTAKRELQHLSLIILDIDHFKRINDTFGHETGDETLRALGECLRKEVRGRDTTARFGGEEFAIILPDTNEKRAILAGERLRNIIGDLEIKGVGHITASFGVSTFPLNGDSRDMLVHTADAALYQAKHLGRNCVVSYENPSKDEVIEDEKDSAIEKIPEIEIVFNGEDYKQPNIALDENHHETPLEPLPKKEGQNEQRAETKN